MRLFGHIARWSPQEDHHRAIAAMTRKLLPDWKRPLGRPSHTWLRAVETDLGQLNIGLTSAWRKAVVKTGGALRAPAEYAMKEERDEIPLNVVRR